MNWKKILIWTGMIWLNAIGISFVFFIAYLHPARVNLLSISDSSLLSIYILAMFVMLLVRCDQLSSVFAEDQQKFPLIHALIVAVLFWLTALLIPIFLLANLSEVAFIGYAFILILMIIFTLVGGISPRDIVVPSSASTPTTKRIELGLSPEQITADLGQPEKIISLGSKMIFIYKDMKIVFVDDKAADIQ